MVLFCERGTCSLGKYSRRRNGEKTKHTEEVNRGQVLFRLGKSAEYLREKRGRNRKNWFSL